MGKKRTREKASPTDHSPSTVIVTNLPYSFTNAQVTHCPPASPLLLARTNRLIDRQSPARKSFVSVSAPILGELSVLESAREEL
ncbi:hypothetical protein MLD38_013862 [Melastoma candidum]|uniref:Uncharacterized protein n=1 Tax=Melastoma candidum TaxID=119954 RepID=A0ACB9RF43_9MYRT|nr:hypothetical protein MLD38_013862 [Melastoma candidum]